MLNILDEIIESKFDHLILKVAFAPNIFSNQSYSISPLPESSTERISSQISMGSQNYSFMILTKTCPSICPDLSGGPPIAVQASRVTASSYPQTSACLFFLQISRICQNSMNPVLRESNSEISLQSQNYQKWISSRWRTVSKSYMLTRPLPYSSRSQSARLQQLISLQVSTYYILLY